MNKKAQEETIKFSMNQLIVIILVILLFILLYFIFKKKILEGILNF